MKPVELLLLLINFNINYERPVHLISNKNAFQWDTYRPLQWPSGAVSAGGVSAGGMSAPVRWGVSSPVHAGMRGYTPREQNDRRL